MKDYKIRIPCEEVSRLVQEKAFSEGRAWPLLAGEGSVVRYTDKPYLYIQEEVLWGTHAQPFSSDPLPEISWQEYLYGEGWFFKVVDDDIYFQAQKDNRVYWVDKYGGIDSSGYHTYGPAHHKLWIPCDMHGNTLTIKQESNTMKQELNYTIPWRVKYDSEAELDAMRAVFKGLGCELYRNLEDVGWNFVCCSGSFKTLSQCDYASKYPTVDLLIAITYLLTPVKSQEQLDSERKIAELEDTINNAQLEVEKASQQIRELKGG